MINNNVKIFVSNIKDKHPQCIDWLDEYSTDDETQINIDPTGLQPAAEWLQEPKERGWMLPNIDCPELPYRLNHIRIPYNSNSNPTWHDRDVQGPIHDRWNLFGTSGWNWAQKKSQWVGFDFDSVANHKQGLSAETLEEIKQRAFSLPYVIARTSKSGQGIHLIVRIDPQPTTRTHTEHASLASFVLNHMSSDCGFDFNAAADVGGGILWHWEKGMKDGCCKRIDNI